MASPSYLHMLLVAAAAAFTFPEHYRVAPRYRLIIASTRETPLFNARRLRTKTDMAPRNLLKALSGSFRHVARPAFVAAKLAKGVRLPSR